MFDDRWPQCEPGVIVGMLASHFCRARRRVQCPGTLKHETVMLHVAILAIYFVPNSKHHSLKTLNMRLKVRELWPRKLHIERLQSDTRCYNGYSGGGLVLQFAVTFFLVLSQRVNKNMRMRSAPGSAVGTSIKSVYRSCH